MSDEHVDAAGALLAERHRRARMAEPLLSSRYEDEAVATAEVAAAMARPDASGAVALRAGRLVGYVLGAPKPAESWGPNMWIESSGLAVADGEAETVRDIYATAAARWTDEGRTAHYVLVPASDPALIGAWFRLAFGHQHTHAIRTPLTAPVARSGSVTVRPAVRADIPALAALDVELPSHQRRTPVFSAAQPPTVEEAQLDWESDFDDSDYVNYVAERDGSVIGAAVGCALTKSSAHSGPAGHEAAAFLGFAAVFPHARGAGAGRALGQAVLGWAAEAGFDCVVTDWRETNLLSSRAWPALGFRPSFLRLHRLIGR